MMKRIVLCADDYGQAKAISQSILDLLSCQRLSATSCLVNFPGWSEQAGWLRPYHKKMDIGLHLNFTEGSPLSAKYKQIYGSSFQGLGKLLGNCWLGKLNRAALNAEITAQFHQFCEELGELPRFIDGHQHIHQFPIIREVLLDFYHHTLCPHAVYLRSALSKISASDWLFNTKKIAINQLGGQAFKKLLIKNTIPHNPSFAGIYSFKQAARFPLKFKRMLQEIGDKGLVMCHPGPIHVEKNELMGKARSREYQYLMSQQFIQDCEANRVILSRIG